ncbi:MAG: rane-associated lipoprotein involved in thiamine biosynthesis [Phycisphaerales bacterium]|nr:rane-associated lipoprotein involved in thiamine biosynthesis [Phycisphaerales bacterium]
MTQGSRSGRTARPRWAASLLTLASVAVGCAAPGPAPAEPSAAPPAAAAAPAAATRFEYHAIKLGSDYNLVLFAPDQTAADAAAAAAEAEIDRLDGVFSDYKPDSELSKLSRLTSGGPMAAPVPISDDLYAVLAAAQRVAAMTDGAFDVTVGPYVQLWRRSRRQQQLPSADRLAEARASVGHALLRLDEPVGGGTGGTAGAGGTPVKPATTRPAGHTARLLAPRMRLDVGGIATGYMSDQVLAVLRKRGISRALCDLSGDLAVGDPPPGRAGWVVSVQALTSPGVSAGLAEVANCGFSTSGDTYRFVEVDGVRYSHIVDTRTGLGLTHRIGATTIARDGMAADALATVVCALGPDRGMAFVDRAEREELFGGSGVRITTVGPDGTTAVTESARYRAVEKPAGTQPAK